VRVETCSPTLTLYVLYLVLLCLTDIFYPLYSTNASGWKTSDLKSYYISLKRGTNPASERYFISVYSWKIYNTLVLPTFLYWSENWTLTALQRRRIEAAEMKLLRPLAGHTLYDHKTNDYIRCELRITGILDKLHEYRQN